MNKQEFLEWYGEPSDDYIERINKIVDALQLAVDSGVGNVLSPDDAKRLLTYIKMVEQYIHTQGKPQ